ncbi:MAG: DUF4282 domain-containing protein [Actinomycetota bacterium]
MTEHESGHDQPGGRPGDQGRAAYPPDQAAYPPDQAATWVGPTPTWAGEDQAGQTQAVPTQAGPNQAAQGQAAAAPPPGWSPPPPPPPAAAQPAMQATTSDARGFIASLFDFSFTSFVTPKVVKVLYVLIMIGVGFASLLYVVLAFRLNSFLGIFVLFIGAPLAFVIIMAIYRILLEFFVVIFRISEDIRALRERGGIR